MILSLTVYVTKDSKSKKKLDLKVKKNNYWIMSFLKKRFGSQEKKKDLEASRRKEERRWMDLHRRNYDAS